MIATLEVSTVESGTCSDCGRQHRFRVALAADEAAPSSPVQGFFGTCPTTQRRVWFVISLPADAEAGARLVQMGSPDDETWCPSTDEVEGWGARRSSVREEQFPSRGTLVGGFRATSRMPDRLRLALGCPHRS